MNEFINRFCTDTDLFYGTIVLVLGIVYSLTILRRWK
jgi:hypothetical protein